MKTRNKTKKLTPVQKPSGARAAAKTPALRETSESELSKVSGGSLPSPFSVVVRSRIRAGIRPAQIQGE